MAEPAREVYARTSAGESARVSSHAGSIAALPAAASTRIGSVDALRGFSMFWLVGGDGLVRSFGDMMSGKGAFLESFGAALALQFTHVDWEGFRFYDFIFPLFIFVTGVSIVLSLTRLVAREGVGAAHARVLRRALLLYVLGLIYYDGVGDHWSDIRWVGVLQRIALCYLFASLLFLNFRPRTLVAACIAILVGYWALMTFVPVPGIGAGSFAPDANLANWIDRNYLPGRLWDGTRDPEGLLSTLPAIATCLLGVFAGLLLRDERVAPQTKAVTLMVCGGLMIGAGYLWSLQFPIIKAIWTSSFVLVAGGWSALLLGVFYQVMDVWQRKQWAAVFVWIGANAITLYFLNNIVGFEPFALRFVGGDVGRLLDRLVTPGTGLFVAHAVALALAIALARYLYQRKIFLRV
ncbi:MAG TPA: heparan-alpha-glucosaminide N-acetyltransferase domain-containing protein [Xanthobacteraceae bacterium]|nr:heparan-alpha-glucosaminide N-acetyltransferase domain-containing protein [Xanthobacteraceae bacterium]